MKHRKLERLIDCIAGVIYRGDRDPAPMTLEPAVKVQASPPVPLAALEEQSQRAKQAMEEKRARALSFLAAHPVRHFQPNKHCTEHP